MAEITTLNENDSGSTSRGVINTNFSNLNGQVKIIYKTATETVNNSTTLQNDNELILPVLANEVWVFKLSVLYRSATTPDIKFGWTVPAGTTMSWALNDTAQAVFDESGAGQVAGAGSSTTSIAGNVNGIIFVGSTAGNVNLQWAQNVLEVSDTKVLLGSNIIATKLA